MLSRQSCAHTRLPRISKWQEGRALQYAPFHILPASCSTRSFCSSSSIRLLSRSSLGLPSVSLARGILDPVLYNIPLARDFARPIRIEKGLASQNRFDRLR
jgi:hypothetical protein